MPRHESAEPLFLGMKPWVTGMQPLIRACSHRFQACRHRFWGCSHRFGAFSHRFWGMQPSIQGMPPSIRACSHQFRACSPRIRACRRSTASATVLLDLPTFLIRRGRAWPQGWALCPWSATVGLVRRSPYPLRSSGAALVRCVCETKCLLRHCSWATLFETKWVPRNKLPGRVQSALTLRDLHGPARQADL